MAQYFWQARYGGAVSQPIIPADRRTQWQPGVTYNGGIPNRTTIFTTLSPIGGGADDTSAINTALVNAGAAASAGNPQVVKLNSGLFNVNGNALSLKQPYVTLRGSGLPAAMATGGNLANDAASALNFVSGTWLVKQDRLTNLNQAVLYVGGSPDRINTMLASTNLTADTIKGSFSCTVASNSGLSVGQLILIDQNGDYDPNVFWGNRHDLSAYINGSISGTTLTLNFPINGPTGIDGSANVTFSGTSMTVNSAPSTGFFPELGVAMNPIGVTIFDTSGNYLGNITNNVAYPGPFTMSQSNAGTKNVVIGGLVPITGWSVFDSSFSTFYGFLNNATTLDRSAGTHTNVVLGLGGGSRRFFSRQERSITQLMKITNINGNIITFETPFHYPFKVSAQAQLTTFDSANYPVIDGVSVENLGLFGGQNADFNGNLAMGLCTNSWIKNVESYWSRGGIGLYGCYRCEVRDSFMHETPNPNPGGDGYLCDLTMWTSDCLVENCIMWQGNKNIVMRSCGGGNVLAYNYMDDSLGGTYPHSPEAGANAGHQGTTYMTLIEGNYSHNFQGDSFWGSSIYITAHRNWFSGIRACSPTGDAPNITPCNNLKAYTSVQGPTTFPYGDYSARRMVSVQAGSYFHNFTGNVLGFGANSFSPGSSAQSLLSYNAGGYTTAQTTWAYEEIDATIDHDLNVITWSFGSMQNPINFSFLTGSYLTQLRQGNWDWTNQGGHTPGQRWHGIGGSETHGNGPDAVVRIIPDSYYITTGKPSFFGASVWPWVYPDSGSTLTLPAKARFDNNTPNTV